VRLQLARIEARLVERQITLHLTDAAWERILREGYDPQYGARPLKRYLERQISTPLARLILAGTVLPGGKVEVTADGSEGLTVK